MGQRTFKIITISAICIICLLLTGLTIVLWGSRNAQKKIIDQSVNTGCLSAPIDFTMPDDSMDGLLYVGKTYPTFSNWQKCLHLQHGDIVIYRFAPSATPVARKIAAVGGDKIELVRNPEKNNWHIRVNGDLVKVDGVPYYFGSSADHPISLYEKAHNGLLDSNSLLIFANKPPGGKDSGEFGVVSINDIIAIVANYTNDGRK
jgi:hypothetical protein